MDRFFFFFLDAEIKISSDNFDFDKAAEKFLITKRINEETTKQKLLFTLPFLGKASRSFII